MTYILCFSVDAALQSPIPSEVCSWMLLAVISPGSVDDGLMDAADESARTRPAKAETTHLRDAATAFLKGAGNQ